MDKKLTIITSFYRDAGHLMRNMDITRKFNPRGDHEWILIDNSTGETSFDAVKEEKFTVYKGLEEKMLTPFFLKSASVANSVSLNFGLTKSHTRFICIMDPDFFVVYPNWIDAATEYMDATGIGILSAPYHPFWYQKAHRATGHFMVIDTNIIPKALINFAPSLKDFYLNNKELPSWTGKRRYLRRFHDCGSQIETLFSEAIEYLVPLVDSKATFPLNKLDKILERILPKKWRITNLDYPVISANVRGILSEAESYYWRGYLFAIHLRRYGQTVRGRTLKSLDNGIDEILSQIYAGYRNILEA